MSRPRLLGAGLATLAAGAALWLLPETPPARAPYGRPHQVPVLYMLSAFPFFGALLGEALLRVRQRTRRPAATRLLAQIAALSALAVLRLSTGFPASGHIVLLVFFVAEAPRFRPGHTGRAWALAGWIGLAAMLLIKMALWEDVTTPSLGAALGLLVWWPGAGKLD